MTICLIILAMIFIGLFIRYDPKIDIIKRNTGTKVFLWYNKTRTKRSCIILYNSLN